MKIAVNNRKSGIYIHIIYIYIYIYIYIWRLTYEERLKRIEMMTRKNNEGINEKRMILIIIMG